MSLEPSRETLDRWLAEASRFSAEHVDGLHAAPAVGTLGADALEVAREVSTAIPEDSLPGGLPRILALVERAAEASLNTAGPGYLAYIPGGGLPSSAIADLVAGLLNRYTGVAAAAPALCRLEADVVEWLAREMGYGPGSSGLLTSGGSLANFSAVVAARHHHLGEDADLRSATAYASGQTHHSVAKSLRLAGLPSRNLREVAVDGRWRLSVGALARAVTGDRDAGLQPFLVVASAGTTNTGAIDPLPELAELCRREGLWLHVDGAYGAAFALCDEGRRRLRGLGEADSITLDPHKGLFLPYGTGCLLVREGARLRRSHHTGADYLQDLDAVAGAAQPPSPADLGPELSRPFRGLSLWLPLMLHGAGAFRRALAERLAMASVLHTQLRERVDAILEVVDPPQLSVVALRLRRRPAEPLEAWNTRNAALLAGINGRRRVYLSSTMLPVEGGDAFTLRVCVLSFRTDATRMQAALDDIVAAAVEG